MPFPRGLITRYQNLPVFRAFRSAPSTRKWYEKSTLPSYVCVLMAPGGQFRQETARKSRSSLLTRLEVFWSIPEPVVRLSLCQLFGLALAYEDDQICPWTV